MVLCHPNINLLKWSHYTEGETDACEVVYLVAAKT